MSFSTLRADRIAMALLGGGLLLVALTAFLREVSPPWGATQDAAIRDVARLAGERVAARIPRGIGQIWIPELGRADRCTTCHVAMDGGSALLAAANPARSHPRPELLAAHPVERFGCTLCHGGQGAATTLEGAHDDLETGDDPLLSTARAAKYGLKAAELLEMRCNACHRGQATVEGMPVLNAAKALVEAKRCRSCHVIEGKGAHVGPELDRAGDAPPEHLTFPAEWPHPRTSLAWHAEHLKLPTSVVPGSEMKEFHFTDRESLSLALLVRSWRTWRLPAAWIPKAR